LTLLLLSLFIACANAAPKNETTAAASKDVVVDPFEADGDLRYAADTFCREYTLSNPLAQKIVLPYKPDCHFWWQW
jgi:hypothetical protein